MAPGKFGNRGCQNGLVPGGGQVAHVAQVAWAQPGRVGEACPQISGEPFDGLGAPPLVVLRVEDHLADAVVGA